MISPEVMIGKWDLVKSTNFDAYLKAVGAGWLTSNVAEHENWSVEFQKVGEETWRMITTSTLKTTEMMFRMDGHEFEEITRDGRRCLTTMTFDSATGTLNQKRIGMDGARGGNVTRTFKGDEMEMIAKIEDVEARRWYKKKA